jgi:hypothetical protein
VYVVGVNGCLCVLMDEMACFEFWTYYVDTDLMHLYVVGTDSRCHPVWVVCLEKKIQNIARE